MQCDELNQSLLNQAGIILGPTVLGRLPDVQNALFPKEGDVYLDLLSKIGYIFFIFLSGVKMDPKMVMRTGAKAWTIGVLTVVLPVTGGLILSVVDQVTIHRYRWPAYKTTVGIQNLFPFPVIASMLVDLKIMNSELGRLALASALISDFISNLTSTAITLGRVGQMGFAGIIMFHSTFLTVCLVLFILFIGRPFSLWIIHRTPEGKPVSRMHIFLISLLVLIVVLMSDNVGLNYQYGPFLLGLAIPDGPPLGSSLVDRLETLVSGMLAPLLVTYCGMKVNLVELYDLRFVSVICMLVVVCFVMKLLATFVPALVCGMPVKDSAALSLIMTAQGVVQMSFYYYNYVNQVRPRSFVF